jgi:hypothetical protein
MPKTPRKTNRARRDTASTRRLKKANKSLARAEPAPEPLAAPLAAVPAAPEGQNQTKRALVLDLLQSERGATIQDLVSATGWLAHTTRAALTRLRQAGHEIQRSEGDGGSVYRIAPPSRARRSRKAA